MKNIYYAFILLSQLGSAQYSKTIPISTQVNEYFEPKLYLDKITVSSQNILLKFYFYNPSYYSNTVMLRSIYIDDFKEVDINGLSEGQIFTPSIGKTRFEISIKRPASTLFIKINFAQYETIEKIYFDGNHYGGLNISSVIQKADHEIESNKYQEYLNTINIGDINKLRYIFYFYPDRLSPEIIKDLDSLSNKYEGRLFLRGDSLLLSMLDN